MQVKWVRKKRKKQQLSLILLAFLIFVFFIFCLGLFLFKEFRKSTLFQEGRITLLFSSKPLLLVSLEDKEAVFLLIPEEFSFDFPCGFGTHKVEEIFENKNLSSGPLLAKTFENFLGVPIDGWVLKLSTNNLIAFKTKDEVLRLTKEFTSLRNFLKIKKILRFLEKAETNLSWFDLFKVWWRFYQVRIERSIFLDLTQEDIFSAGIINFNLLDDKIEELFKEKLISSERLTIQILNGTTQVGLAARVSRLVDKIGGTVVYLGNYLEKVDQCQIIGKKQVLESFTVKRLRKIFNCKVLINENKEERADIKIILGENLLKDFCP